MRIISCAKKCLSNVINQYHTNKMRDNILSQNHSNLDLSCNVLDMRKYGFSMIESQIYGLTKDNYRNYISTWETYQPRIKNPSPYFCISDDKYLFSTVFGKYIDVPKTYALIENGVIIPIEQYCAEMDLREFIIKMGGVVIKDRFGSDGFNVYVLQVSENNKVVYKNKDISSNELLQIVEKFKHGIIQSVVAQGNFENRMFPNSVNTIRIISVKKNNALEHEIIGALQRIGTNKSAPVDNFNQGGASALIDLEIGTIGQMTTASSVDEDGNRVFYDVHPDSGERIEGQIIPHWSELKDVVIDITRKVPYFDCIAWDFVIRDDGFSLVETNMKSSLNVFQVHGGMRNSVMGQKFMEHGWLVDQVLF